MAFEVLCMSVIGLLFAAALIFGGYRLFLFLLPIWGFFFGLGLGAQTVQAIFGDAFLATITSWMVGFIVGLIFAVLSYLFYIFAVALISASAGYGLMVSLWGALGFNFGFIAWLLGIIVGVALALVVLRFNLAKIAIIIITSAIGAGASILVFLAVFGSGLVLTDLVANPVMSAIQNSFWWLIYFLIVAAFGIFVQMQANRSFEIDTYNRYVAE